MYAQDQWTLDRLTINMGLRFDYFNGHYPDQMSAAGERHHSPWGPASIFVPGATAASWKDLQPRLGVVYDLRGDGRTALKASASRFGSRDAIALAGELNPIANNTTMSRLWFDGAPGHFAVPLPIQFPACIPSAADPTGSSCVAGDGLVQGDPLNPYPNGELLGPSDNPSFGAHTPSNFFDPDWAFGWGKKKGNWEYSGSIQHELLDNVSVDFGYFRRVYFNFSAWDNRNIGPDDFVEYSIMVPEDSRLPGGGGHPLTVVDLSPEAALRPQNNWQSSTDEYEMWHGIDLSMSARLEEVLLQGGLATGRRITDYCDFQQNQPEVLYGDFSVRDASRVGRGTTGQLAGIAGSRGTLLPREFCRAEDAWLTNLSLSGSYTFPYDIDVSAAFFSRPGPRREAIYQVPLTEAAAALGRRPTLDRVALNVVQPGTAFGDRLNQLDLRIAKVFNFGVGGNVRASFDVYNLMNENAVSREQQALGPSYLMPIGLQAGRLIKLSFQYNF